MFAAMSIACFLTGITLGAIAGVMFACTSSQPKRDDKGRFTKG